MTFSIVEQRTGRYLTFIIGGKDTHGAAIAMEQLNLMFGEHVSKVFCNITTDNGSEFAAFSQFVKLGCEVYLAHPYFSWEQPVNAKSNRLLRQFMPHGVSMKHFSCEDICLLSDKINAIPRKKEATAHQRNCVRSISIRFFRQNLADTSFCLSVQFVIAIFFFLL